MAEDEGGSGFIKSAAQEIWLGSAQVGMYLGRYPSRRRAAAGGLLAAGRGQVGDQPTERRAGGNTGLGRRGLHLGVGQTPGTDTPGTLGTSQLGQSQGCGTNGHLDGPAARTLEACFHSPVEHGHSVRWACPASTTRGSFLQTAPLTGTCQGMLGMDRQGVGGLGGLGPAHLGKLLQARRDLNLPSLGCADPHTKYSQDTYLLRSTYIHTVLSASQPASVCLSACLPCLSVWSPSLPAQQQAIIIEQSLQLQFVFATQAVDYSLYIHSRILSRRCFENIMRTTVASQPACARQSLMVQSQKRIFAKAEECCRVRMPLLQNTLN